MLNKFWNPGSSSSDISSSWASSSNDGELVVATSTETTGDGYAFAKAIATDGTNTEESYEFSGEENDAYDEYDFWIF